MPADHDAGLAIELYSNERCYVATCLLLGQLTKIGRGLHQRAANHERNDHGVSALPAVVHTRICEVGRMLTTGARLPLGYKRSKRKTNTKWLFDFTRALACCRLVAEEHDDAFQRDETKTLLLGQPTCHGSPGHDKQPCLLTSYWAPALSSACNAKRRPARLLSERVDLVYGYVQRTGTIGVHQSSSYLPLAISKHGRTSIKVVAVLAVQCETGSNLEARYPNK